MIARRPLILLGAALLVLVGGAAALIVGQPAGARESYERALVHYSEGSMGAARVELLNALDAEPGFASAHLLQARVLNVQGNGEGAAEAIARARASGAPEAATRAILAEALLVSGDAEGAIAEASLSDIPPAASGEAARVRALAHAAMGDRPSAARAFDQAIAADPGNVRLWLDVADFRLDGDNIAAAIVASERAVAADTRNVEALLLRGDMVRRQYGLVAAIPWYDRALAVDPDHVPTLLARAAALGDSGRAIEMLADARRVLDLSPGDARAYYMLAVLAARAGDYELARTLAGRMGNWGAGVPGIMLLHGLLDYQAGNYESAIERLGALVEAQPANLKAQRLLGAAHFRAGDTEGALRILLPLARRADAGTYVLTLVGRAYERLGRSDDAAAFLDRAVFAPVGPAAPLAPPGMTDAQLAYYRGEAESGAGDSAEVALIRSYLALGRERDALALAASVARANPNAPRGLVLLGDALAATGRFGEAAQLYARAGNIDFSESIALKMIEALQRAGAPDDARRVLATFLGQNPSSVPAATLAAELHLRAGNWDEAIAVLENLRARIGNRDAALMANLGWAYHHAGDAEAARLFARRAYLLMPMSAVAANRYGWILWSGRGRRSLGLAMLEKARDLAPDDAGVQWHLAQAYAELGRPTLARRAAERALADEGFAERAAATALLARL